MFSRLNPSVRWALVILGGCILWVASGIFAPHDVATTPPPLSETEGVKSIASVRVRVLRNEAHAADLVLRGRTSAENNVELKSEMSGRVVSTPAAKGQDVKAGDPVCQLDVGPRQAQLEQAKAQLRQAQLEYDAAVSLEKKGHRSETQTAAARAAFEAAEANIRVMEQQLSYTVMRAPFDGRVDFRMVAIGDYMTPGMPCARIVAGEPFLIVGAVAESQIGQLGPGTMGSARLVTGETVEGKVTFLASAADAATRTFRVELTVPNDGFKLRDGVTADIRIRARDIPAMRLSPAILSLDDGGKVGVKIVENGVVRFVPVALISDSAEGVWVSGLPDEATVITVGQDYVKDGEAVNAVPEEAVTAGGVAPAGSAAN